MGADMGVMADTVVAAFTALRGVEGLGGLWNVNVVHSLFGHISMWLLAPGKFVEAAGTLRRLFPHADSLANALGSPRSTTVVTLR